MGYADYTFYATLYSESAILESDFNRLSWLAFRKMDASTTGVDGVKKLKVAFPTDEDSAEAVRRCACALIHTMAKIEEQEKSAIRSHGYEETENGLRGKVISSLSAGNESISYSANAGKETVIEKAAFDKSAREKLYRDIITEYLSSVQDGNGVNLLYMGRYPFELRV